MFNALYKDEEYGVRNNVTIYDVTYDVAGFPIFLFYFKGQWLRKSAKLFVPINN